MKNIPIFSALVSRGEAAFPKWRRRIGFSLFFLLLVFPRAAGEEAAPPLKYSFDLSYSTGFLYGQGEEVIYKYPSGNTYYSQLLWDMKPIFYIGSGLEFSQTDPLKSPGFLIKLSLQFGIPGVTGIMEDRDWLHDTEDYLTNYSQHDAFAESLIITDFRAGISVPLFTRLIFKTYLGVSFQYLKWNCRDGYYQYAPTINGIYSPWTDSLTKYPLYGVEILYSQQWLAIFPGVSLGASFLERFSWELGCAVSPFLYGTAHDEHLVRGTQYDDLFSDNVLGGLYLESRGDLVFTPKPGIDLGIGTALKIVKSQRGTGIVTRGDNKQYLLALETGGGYFSLDLGVSIKIAL